MSLISRNSLLLLTLAFAGCAGSLRPADLAAPEAAVVGDYQLTGRVAGVRVEGSVRFDSAGVATLFFRSSTPSYPVLCNVQPSIDDGRLMLACGSVRLSLAVADAEVAPEGRVSFEVSRPARRQFDPFACRIVGDLSCGALGREVSAPNVRRYTGNIAVLRVGAD